jgi:hypothetical protein
MSENDDLDPALLRHLRDVPPASASMRDAHISAALAEMAPSRSAALRRTRILGGVAAAMVLTLGGVAISRQQRESGRRPLNGVTTTTMPKGGGDCAEESSGIQGDAADSKEFTFNGDTYVLVFRDDAVDVFQAVEECLVGTLSYRDAMLERDKESSLPHPTHKCGYLTEPVARFSDAAGGDPYNLVLVQTDDGLSVEFDDICDVSIDAITLP